MKTITVLAYNRPDYLRQCLEALRQCRGIGGYRVLVSIDGGGGEAGKQCAHLVANYKDVELAVLFSNYGIDFHNYRCFNVLMNHSDSDFNIAIEDDCLLTPDALELADWFYLSPDRDFYSFLSLGDPMYRQGPYAKKELMDLHESQSIYTGAWCFTKQQWQMISKDWNHPLKTQVGWDWSLSYNLWHWGFKSLYPLVSRARNIGRIGVHSHPEFFDAHIAPARFSDGTAVPIGFKIAYRMDGEPTPQWIVDEEAATEDRYVHLRNK